ncbi:hypothetical protein VNI00_004792 [Paramarasmius palmivorus]|uniref:FBD domain-containing protein n=1 Tax=Paramarasmius palmivorus TaxID=297713 RepID=A0AAW0DJ72_9AGAR
MNEITLEPRTRDVSERYITSLVESHSKPPLRHIHFDIAIAMYQILYTISQSCSKGNTQSLGVSSSIRYADWHGYSTVFIQHLLAHIPNIKVLQVKPVDSRLQFALTSAYSSTLVKLTIYCSIGKTGVGWSRVTLPCLESITLVQDYCIPAKECSISLLVAKFVEAPKLKHASIVAIEDGRVFSLYELLLAFAATLESVKILGEFFYETSNQRLVPQLPNVTSLHIEAELAHCLLMHSDNALEYLPKLERLVIEGDWQTLESTCYNVRWGGIKETLTRIAAISPRPVIICGYRGAEVFHRTIFSRVVIGQLINISGWDVRDAFVVEERRCEDLPSRRPAYIDSKPQLRDVPAVKRTVLSDSDTGTSDPEESD